MASPQEKLAKSLDVLRKLQNEDGAAAIKGTDISRTHRDRLIQSGFLQEVMKGWYIPARPDDQKGDSTAWYASYWKFCAIYLNERFGKGWSLSPEQSISAHSGNWTVPQQLLVRAPKARNKTTSFPHNTSLFEVRAALPEVNEREELEGLRVFSLPSALIQSGPSIFRENPLDARLSLKMIRDSSDILPGLLRNGSSVIAGRLAGAFRNVGMERIADAIIATMRGAGYDVRENDPFQTKSHLADTGRQTSPYVNRIRLMWRDMRENVIASFPKAPGLSDDAPRLLKEINEVYKTDAFHSLSIEGYRVSPDLIERVKSGTWNPAGNDKEKEEKDALAARGYYQAFESVKTSIAKILNGSNPGQVADQDHGTWFRELFDPSVQAGIIKPADLAGYRNGPVYIRGSKHTPLNRDAVRDAMPTLFELLGDETEPSVRVVLGHFIFVFIHPYMDGNGRIGRFLMNVMLISGGYPWTIVPMTDQQEYMEALEQASVHKNIIPFSSFISRLVKNRMSGKPLPEVPRT